MKKSIIFVLAAIMVLGFAWTANAQEADPPAPAPDMAQGPMAGPMSGPMAMRGGIMAGRRLGKWWKNSEMVQKLGLSDAQIQQIEKIFQDHRLKLIDLRANLQREEVLLQPLVEADNPDEAKITAQIDKVANARATLEKSNALMLLAIRKVLKAEQWKTLQAERGAAVQRWRKHREERRR